MLNFLSCREMSQPLRLVLDTNVVMALWHFEDPKLA
ncbi:MAG: hypothetical protein H6R19_2759, partial [Proteobacteria bacterium]|nr:hypothetical protein [Pseudomonadota bacterium]